jgi:hypothetical protein
MSKYGLILGYERSKLDFGYCPLRFLTYDREAVQPLVPSPITIKAFQYAPFISAVGILGTAP